VLSVKSVNVCFVLQFETPETVDFSNNDNWEVPNSSLQCTRIREIGHGQFGEVWQEGLLGNITPVAIKTLKPGILNILGHIEHRRTYDTDLAKDTSLSNTFSRKNIFCHLI
jgi:hypothetical protein